MHENDGFDVATILGVGEDIFREWSVTEQREAVRDALDTDEYRPCDNECVHPDDCSRYNPAIEVYRATHEWGDGGWSPIDDLTPFRSVPEYLPTDAAIDTLSGLRLIEIGAGSGYWAHVINHAGGDVVPTDAHPPVIAPDAHPPVTTITPISDSDVSNCGTGNSSQLGKYETRWQEVLPDSHHIVRNYAERDVLLCHPSAFGWTEELLDLLRPEQKLIYVGEWYPGHDATVNFHHRLNSNWTLERTFPVLDWESQAARGFVFR